LKLSKKSLLIIAIGIFIIALVGLWMVQSQQVNELNQLKEKLNTAELKLSGLQPGKLSQRQEELERQLSQTMSQSETARTSLSQPIESIAINDLLYDIAEAHNVEVTEISSSGIASEELAGITCSVLPLTAKVEGEVTDIARFITKLNEELATGVVKSVEIRIPETTDEGEETSADIQVVIYTYRGASNG
jgi:hypothetical protein